MAKLIVNPTSANRREIPLSRSTILTIGRDPSNDLVLPDAMVSRRHAVVEHRGRQFFLRDCSSANGSVVNGDRVSERALRDGDLVAIGSMRLLFRDDPVEAGRRQDRGAPLGRSAPLPLVRRRVPPRRPLLPRVRRAGGAAERAAEGRLRLVRDGGAAAGALLQRAAGRRSPADGERAAEPAADEELGRRDTQPVPARAEGPPAPRASGSMAMAPERRRRPARRADRRRRPGRARGSRAPGSRASGGPSPPRAASRAEPGAPGEPAGRVRRGHRVRALRAGGDARARRLVLVGARGARARRPTSPSCRSSPP